MAKRMLKRYGLEGGAKALISIGLLLILVSWFVAAYYFGITGKIAEFIIPFLFTCIAAILLFAIRYRYTLFEKYPYLMNLPSIFYRIGRQNDTGKQSVAFSMIFTVHALVIAFMGVMSILLTFTVGYSIQSNVKAASFLYLYFAVIAILIVSMLLQYRRIYIRFSK